jgi:hypothetical protein
LLQLAYIKNAQGLPLEYIRVIGFILCKFLLLIGEAQFERIQQAIDLIEAQMKEWRNWLKS